MRQPTVYLLSCGDEILFGHTIDTNAAWLADQCTQLGWRVLGQRTVGDVTPDIIASFLDASSRADIVIHTGGLGPTEDDRTRSALAHAMGVDLVLDADALSEIEAVFRRYNRPMTDSNRVQAMLPRGSRRVVNPGGTAPGIDARLGSARVFCLPGVPREMRDMFDRDIRPVLQAAEGVAKEVLRRLHLCGRGESEIAGKIAHLMAERANPEVGTTVADSIITIRIYAKGDTLAEAAAIADKAEADIRSALGPDIFGADDATLAEAVYRQLRDCGAGLITAESCTGGMLSGMLVDIPGVSEVFLEGVVSYSNEAKTRRLGVDPELLKKHGAVSREVAAAMAENPLRRGDFPGPVYSLSTTGVAGPDGGTPEKPVGTVWIACSRLDADGNGATRTMLYNTVSDRLGIRRRAAYAALDLLRRTMLGHQSNFAVEETTWRLD